MAQIRQLSRTPEIQGTSGTLRGRLARALGIFQQKNIRVPTIVCVMPDLNTLSTTFCPLYTPYKQVYQLSNIDLACTRSILIVGSPTHRDDP